MATKFFFCGYKKSHISTSTTTVVKAKPGLLSSIAVNNPGTGCTVTVYDNTAGSGTVLAVLSGMAAACTLLYEIPFNTGLTIVTAGGTPADLTVAYL